MREKPLAPLMLTETGIELSQDGSPAITDTKPLHDAIAWLTGGRVEAAPEELWKLVRVTLQAMVTGHDVERLRRMYVDYESDTNARHRLAMDVIEYSSTGPMEAFPPSVIARSIRSQLLSFDERFADCSPSTFAWAVTQARTPGAALPTILAHLCAECGAFDVPKDGREATLERARGKFVKARARTK